MRGTSFSTQELQWLRSKGCGATWASSRLQDPSSDYALLAPTRGHPVSVTTQLLHGFVRNTFSSCRDFIKNAIDSLEERKSLENPATSASGCLLLHPLLTVPNVQYPQDLGVFWPSSTPNFSTSVFSSRWLRLFGSFRRTGVLVLLRGKMDCGHDKHSNEHPPGTRRQPRDTSTNLLEREQRSSLPPMPRNRRTVLDGNRQGLSSTSSAGPAPLSEALDSSHPPRSTIDLRLAPPRLVAQNA
ncbi:hypothetical protein BKA70DRAFT_218561 [Coprinopsis sp. MPI-PUGE-AT-0042]|nr:hypothetical protein BKA70DRAFT_218561 [Coprinopsis sp. MPI-PUGE-AT-0042]